VLGRRLDRYVTSFFVWHFLACLAASLVLYIVIDTFAKLDEFVEHEDLLETIRWIFTYHLYQIPALLSQFIPIVTLIAGVICLARLARYNELNAMKASGISIHRALVPVYLCTLAIGGLAAANQELLVPDLEGRIRTVRLEALKSQEVYTKLHVFDEGTRSTVYIPRLDNAAPGWHLSRVEAKPQQAGGALPPAPSFAGGQAIWAGDTLFLFLPVEGEQGTFTRKALLADTEAKQYSPPNDPSSRLADGTPAYAITAKIGDRAYDVRFAECERMRRLRLLRAARGVGVLITSGYQGEDTLPPIDLHTALWYDDACKRAIGDGAIGSKGVWLAQGQTYVQSSPTRRETVLFDGDPVTCGNPPVEFAATPQRLIQSNVDPSLSSFASLQRLSRQVPVLRQRITVVLHGRVAFPLASLVLLLVAIPLLFQEEGGKSSWTGMGMALIVSMLFYFANYYCQMLGQLPGGIFSGAPGMSAWVPIILFGGAGAYLLATMET